MIKVDKHLSSFLSKHRVYYTALALVQELLVTRTINVSLSDVSDVNVNDESEDKKMAKSGQTSLC